MSKLVFGLNDLEIWCRNNNKVELLSEWDYEKNPKLPKDYAAKSTVKVYWKHWHEEAKQWHVWQATIANRTHNNSGCPYCSLGRPQLLKGFNDLETWCNKNQRKDILSEWDFSKNNTDPTDYFPTSHRKVWWKCSRGHSWDMTIAHRTSMGCGCPICANLRVEVGSNDLETWCRTNHREEIIEEWDYKRNEYIPSQVVPQSHKKVYWKCKLGHTWKAVIKDRVTRGDGCPECSKRRRTSFPEQAIYFYIKKIFPDAINGDRHLLGGLELDIFIPSINTAIEYDGQAYHKDVARDRRKNTMCKEKGIAMCRVRENGCHSEMGPNCAYVVSVIPGDIYDLTKAINSLIDYLSNTHRFEFNVDVDVQRDQIEIENTYIFDILANSFAQHHPDVAMEWDYEKNGDITPYKIAKTSTQKYYWICTKGHPSYLSSPANRHLGSGCPICANVQVLEGYNDLETWCQENGQNNLLAEWDYEKNETSPKCYLPKSNARVWWKCTICGHSWQTKIEDRTSRSRGCPKCAIQKRAQKNTKRVRNDDTGEIFESAKEAYQKYKGSITACCLGKSKTAAGYHWSYVDESD